MRGKVVLITGASSGIGAGTAVLFASRGCLLSLTARSQERLRNTQQDCIKAGAKEDDILLISLDLQVQESLDDIVGKTVQRFGRLDVLINNAGCIFSLDLEHVTLDKYETVMNTNLKAVFFLTQKALPHLIQSKGNVVNVSGCLSQRCSTSSILHCISKAGIDHFTRTAALDLAPKNVRVNAISPGGVYTRIFQNTKVSAKNFERVFKVMHPIGRGGTLEEIAKGILFLADDEQSSFVTGVNLPVDGGYLLNGPQRETFFKDIKDFS